MGQVEAGDRSGDLALTQAEDSGVPGQGSSSGPGGISETESWESADGLDVVGKRGVKGDFKPERVDGVAIYKCI